MHWKIADEFYLGSYEIYTNLEKEIDKYNTVFAKKEELMKLLAEIL